MKHVNAMLPTDTPVDQLIALCEDPAVDATQKIDGHHCLTHIEDGKIVAVARSGLILNVRRTMFEPFAPLVATGDRWVFDGEYLNGAFYCFDLVEAAGLVTQTTPYEERRHHLVRIWEAWNPTGPIGLVPSMVDTEDKAQLAKTILETGGEGLVFKRLNARYIGTDPRTPSKRSGLSFKVKFRKDIDCVVTELRRDGKANMVLSVYDDDGMLVEVGECSALSGDGATIQVGDVVTVTYQHASEANKLVSAVKPRRRIDKAATDCHIGQLVYANKTVHL